MNFGKLVIVLIEYCDIFRDMLKSFVAWQPSTPTRPWPFVLHFDETVPGDPFRLDQTRKFIVVYGSFRESGLRLKHEALWLPISMLRVSLLKLVIGKWSNAFRVLLRSLFPDEGNLQQGLVALKVENAVMFVALGNILGDEGGLRQAWVSKGANGMIPVACESAVRCSAEAALCL